MHKPFNRNNVDFEANNKIADIHRKIHCHETLTNSEITTFQEHGKMALEVFDLIDSDVSQNEKLANLWKCLRSLFLVGLEDTPPWSGDPPRRNVNYIFEIVGKPKALSAAMEDKYDVIISYKQRRNAAQARYVADALRSKGLKVWFDVDVLNLRDDEHVNRDVLAAYLVAAIKSCRIAVVFAAQMEAVALPPGTTESGALSGGGTMFDDRSGAIIAWNWQKLEIDNAKRMVAVHQNLCAFGDRVIRFDGVYEMVTAVVKLVTAVI